jgi:hypothetical protein
VRRLLALIACGVTGCSLPVVSSAWAAPEGPQWTVTAVSAPTNFVPGDESGDDFYKVLVTNTGGAESKGTIEIADELPPGLTLDHAGAEGYESSGRESHRVKGAALSCEGLTCTFSRNVIPQETLVLTIPVDVELKGPATVTNVVRVSGGGALDATMSTPTTISSTPAGFGIAAGSATTALSSTQAGAHADLTTTIGFNTLNDEGKIAGYAKEVVDDFPPGFAGDLVDTPTCPVAVFQREECPIETQIGVQTTTTLAHEGIPTVYTSAVYNLTPDPGDVAKIGFRDVGETHIQGDVTVSPDEYRLQTRFENIIEVDGAELDSTSLTVWGVPTASIHNPWRWNPNAGLHGEYDVSSTNPLVPYLSNPTSCTSGPVHATIFARSWKEPEAEPSEAGMTEAQMPFGPFEDCDRLRLPATFVAQPTTQEAYAPTGLNTELGVHQTYDNAEGLSSANLNGAVVTLPEGMTVNPSAGAGLGSCMEAEYEYEQKTVEPSPGQGCPADSKLGSVKIQAPALKEEASGSVYTATPYDNQFDSLLALYVVARIPNRGVVVASAGKVTANPVTGQLTTVFEDLPQLPFTTFTLSFQSEPSPLVSPPACGSFTATAELTSWSNLSQVLTDTSPPFAITRGSAGSACPTGGVPPFHPQVVSYPIHGNAGIYSPFYLRISREDGEQEITGFASRLPPGLTANLTGVPFCSEADIALARTLTGAQEEAEPSCPAASEIGHTEVGAGVGKILAYTHGKIYMAGPFEGAPFSIVAITSAKVGPFDLGTVVVHLPLQIDPVTAAVSIPTGPADQIPHIIDGIVIHVRDIRVYIERPDFMLNPTNCDPMSFSATVIGSGASFADPADGVPVTVADPFQVADCASLAFTPGFHASTSGRTSKADGASLTATLTYPSAPQGTQANIAKVKVELPKRLPTRLTTLQKACAEIIFDADPAGCPAGSVVGMARAITPIIPVPLTGPAYFVSHGGAKFPELIIVLQGYGVTLALHGETFISKKGVTTSTFASVPDAPVGSFELELLQGPHSALAANGDLCKGKLAMPTTFTAQNGAVIHQSTTIKVTGCPKKKIKHRSKKAGKASEKHRTGKTT